MLDYFAKMAPKMKVKTFSWKSFSFKFFSGRFAEIWAKILHIPKNLRAPTTMR